jgi:hypothetical protein
VLKELMINSKRKRRKRKRNAANVTIVVNSFQTPSNRGFALFSPEKMLR